MEDVAFTAVGGEIQPFKWVIITDKDGRVVYEGTLEGLDAALALGDGESMTVTRHG
jgi:hypothetical protein